MTLHAQSDPPVRISLRLARSLLTPLMAILATGCQDALVDPQPGSGLVQRSELVGTWTATTFKVTTVPAEETVDMLTWGAEVTLHLSENATLVGRVIWPEGEPSLHPADTTDITGAWSFAPPTRIVNMVVEPDVFIEEIVLRAERGESGFPRVSGLLLQTAVPRNHSTVEARVEVVLDRVTTTS